MAKVTKKATKTITPEKTALLKLLQQQFKQVECNVTFEWLRYPQQSKNPEDYGSDYKAIVKALFVNCETDDCRLVRSPGTKIECDFVVPKHKLIIEIDEKQHFTTARKIALQHYPRNVKLSFNKSLWIKLCDLYNQHDRHPIYRDAQRALYDSIRDIAAFRNGWTLIRIEAEHIKWLTKIL